MRSCAISSLLRVFHSRRTHSGASNSFRFFFLSCGSLLQHCLPRGRVYRKLEIYNHRIRYIRIYIYIYMSMFLSFQIPLKKGIRNEISIYIYIYMLRNFSSIWRYRNRFLYTWPTMITGLASASGLFFAVSICLFGSISRGCIIWRYRCIIWRVCNKGWCKFAIFRLFNNSFGGWSGFNLFHPIPSCPHWSCNWSLLFIFLLEGLDSKNGKYIQTSLYI